MTKSNNEWVPEVGHECEAQIYPIGSGRSEWVKCEVLKLNHNELHAVLADDTLYWAKNLRPIKTEAEKRRDEQIAFMNEVCCEFHREREIGLSIGEVLFKADCRITKPLTEGVITQIWRYHSGLRDCPHFKFAKAIESYVLGELD